MQQIKGVQKIESGYIGGQTSHPSYREVCKGLTGHAEAVRLSYDPSQVSYKQLLMTFFATHDPTTLNRQGADTGSQYRSAIFPMTAEQKQIAQEIIEKLAPMFDKPIVTSIEEADIFYVAETEHQNFYASHQQHPYCRAVISPKLAKLRQANQELLIK